MKDVRLLSFFAPRPFCHHHWQPEEFLLLGHSQELVRFCLVVDLEQFWVFDLEQLLVFDLELELRRSQERSV